jgi:hypothetical protein
MDMRMDRCDARLEALTDAMRGGDAAIKDSIAATDVSLRALIASGNAALKDCIAATDASLRAEIASAKVSALLLYFALAAAMLGTMARGFGWL